MKVKIVAPPDSVTRATPGSAGYDLRATRFLTLPPGGGMLVPTGVRLQMPEGLHAEVRPRSGMSTKYHVIIPNSPGTIDPDYTGEIGVYLLNLGTSPYGIIPGQRIAQLVFTTYHPVEFEYVEELHDTDRGDKGFGSTGS